MIELKDINVLCDEKEDIIDGCFIAYSNQITSIIDKSGSGKNTLLYILAMLVSNKCKYYYNGKLLAYDKKQQMNFRNKYIAFITKNSLLIDTISVEKNIEFYLQQANNDETVDDLLIKLNLINKKEAMPSDLSDAELQRAILACGLAKNTKIILIDDKMMFTNHNDELILNLLKSYANQGKIVILAGNDESIVKNSDRVYCLENSKLTLEKESKSNLIVQDESFEQSKIDIFRIFKILFCSNKEHNLRRIVMSFIVMSILFASASVFNFVNNNFDNRYATNYLTPTKLLAISDESSFFHQINDGLQIGYGLHYIYHQEPLDTKITEQMESIENIKKIYDYYTFNYSLLSASGFSQDMSVKVIRDDQEITRRKLDSDENYSFSIIPFFPEEKLDLDKGIYVNSNMAYNYNIEVGDTLELEINVPYAMAKSIDKQILGFDDGTKGRAYHQVACIGEKVPLTVKVAGIIEMDSQVSNEIYLSNKIMTKMIDEQVKRYHDGEINLDYQLYEKYTTIIDLKPYAKAIFVDDEKHVEKVQKEISEISDLVFVYNEYQNTLELKNDNNLMKDVMAKMTFICIGMFILATLLVEIFYLKRYKSTYMIFRLNGYCNYQKNKIFIIHGLYQGLIILCMAVVVYVVGSLPLIIGDRTDLNISLIRSLFPDLYIKFSDFAMFSWEHFMFFVIVLIFVVVITYLIVWLFYQRQDIINYLEDESDENDNC